MKVSPVYCYPIEIQTKTKPVLDTRPGLWLDLPRQTDKNCWCRIFLYHQLSLPPSHYPSHRMKESVKKGMELEIILQSRSIFSLLSDIFLRWMENSINSSNPGQWHKCVCFMMCRHLGKNCTYAIQWNSVSPFQTDKAAQCSMIWLVESAEADRAVRKVTWYHSWKVIKCHVTCIMYIKSQSKEGRE